MRGNHSLPYRGASVVYYLGAVTFNLLNQVGFDPVFTARVTEDDFAKFIAPQHDKAVNPKAASVTIDGIDWTHEFSRKHWTGRMSPRRSDVLIGIDRVKLEAGTDRQSDPWQTIAA